MPLDPNYPQDRLDFMLKDSGAKYLLCQDSLRNLVSFSANSLVIEDYENNLTSSSFDFNLKNINQPSDLAYVIYTSGTTGRPKGVMIEHRNVVSLLKRDTFQFNFNEKDVWTLFHSFCFDFSVWEMYGALLFGGKLVVVPKGVTQDPNQFLKLLNQEKVTVLNQTPSSFYQVIEAQKSHPSIDLNLKYIIFGGEALKPGKLKSFRELYPQTKLINMYGITETTVHVTYKEITEVEIKAGISNIGQAIPTLTTYIFDSKQKVLPVGQAGELYVGGGGVARGYLNRPELTQERFIQNPYNADERLYRSGDLVRQLPTGEMEYLGRVDHQVKIRGFRIELGEIESRLLQHPKVKEAIVIAHEDPLGDTQLCAYIVGEKVALQELREALAQNLPSYMIPSHFIKLEKFPLTTNGKVDRKALPQLHLEERIQNEDYVAPRNEIEKKLGEIWQEVLGLSKIGIRDNFFELGGHSLKAVQIHSRIQKAFNIELALIKILHLANIADLAQEIEKEQRAGHYKKYKSIPKLAAQKFYTLSHAQQRLWFLDQYEQNSAFYNIPFSFEVKGKFKAELFYQALATIVERHETLRMAIKEVNGQPMQFIRSINAKEASFEYQYQNSSGFSKEEIEKLVRQEVRKPFNLSKGPLLRCLVLKINSELHEVHLVLHHIVSDGWSIGILEAELQILYNTFLEGKKPQLSQLKIQYQDYAHWQNQLLNSEFYKKQKNYWLKKLSGELPVLNLPTDYPRPKVMKFNGSRERRLVAKEFLPKLKQIGNREHDTLFITLLAAFKVWLFKLTGQEDLIVGTPVAGRDHPDIENLIGFFVNTLAIRSQINPNETFLELLDRLKEEAFTAYENQEYPFDKLIEELNPDRDTSRSPIFSVMLTAPHGMEQSYFGFKGTQVQHIETEYDQAKFDLHLDIKTCSQGLNLNLEYNTDLFAKNTIQRFLKYFKNLLEHLVDQPEKAIKHISIMDREEQTDLVQAICPKIKDYPKEKCIHHLFEEQAEKTPHQTALCFQSQSLSYKELNQKSNQLARYLKEHGVGIETPVGILMNRSPEMMIGLLAILKSGASYVPLDPQYPVNRIQHILDKVKAPILLTQKDQQSKLSTLKGRCLILDAHHDVYSTYLNENLDLPVKSSQRAYMIFTSGSTGRPKGVMIQHQGVINLLKWMTKTYQVNENSVVIQSTSMCFDVSVWELFGPLSCGATLALIENEILKDGKALLNKLEEVQATHMSCVPSLYQLMIGAAESEPENKPALKSMQWFLLAGEALKRNLVERSQACYPDISIANIYGPTEATVYAAYFNIPNPLPSGDIPIGKPIDNAQLYVLDSDMNLVPPGVVGELCIGGVGLAQGYFNDAEKTQQAFVANPFRPSEKLYKTGDLVRLCSGGNLAYLGRKDFQVKIRGNRIELGEIENQLLGHQDIQHCVVVVQGAEDPFLAAYYSGTKNLAISHLREFLQAQLPEYMIPQYFIKLEQLPLNPNGKIDRKALPEPSGERPELHEQYIAPVDKIEQSIAEIWQEVLKVDRIGIQDNFFDLGGHSLLIVKVHQRLNQVIKQNIPLVNLFQFPTIKTLVNFLNQESPANKNHHTQIEKRKQLRVLRQQKRSFRKDPHRGMSESI